MSEELLPLSDQVRAAIDASGYGHRALCRDAGIDPGLLSRFRSGEGGLSMSSLDALARVLGLHLSRRPTKLSRRTKGQRR